MYNVKKVMIHPKDTLYPYCETITSLTNNLHNAIMYLVRQVYTGTRKAESELTPNEKEIFNLIKKALPIMGDDYKFPTQKKSFLSYRFIDAYMKATENVDYYKTGLPRQTAQHAIKGVVKNMKGYYASLRSYKQSPSSFTGRPNLPGYHKKGGKTTAVITNQDCKIKQDKTGKYVAHLPLTKLECELGSDVVGRLKEVTIKPFHDVFIISFVFDSAKETKEVTDKPERICAIDFGVNNIAAITNNIGAPSLLFKGGVIKSNNQLYNKRMAEIVSSQTKGTDKKFVPTEESHQVCLRRENQISDFMHKLAKRIIEWCVQYQIDTMVLGVNKFWKQNINLGKHNNQNFVQIPFYRLRQMLTYLGEWNGIRVIEQEESYTSKASFLDDDFIPVYGDKNKPKFSGRRISRGLYRIKNKAIVNADLNASANIGRKAFPALFNKDAKVRFDTVEVYYHPDATFIAKNKARQKARYKM